MENNGNNNLVPDNEGVIRDNSEDAIPENNGNVISENDNNAAFVESNSVIPENIPADNSAINNEEKIADTSGEEIINYNGSWENNKRSIIAGAVTALVGVGAIYFNVQTFLMIIALLVSSAFSSDGFSGDMSEAASGNKIPMLIGLTISQYVFMLLPALLIVKKWHTTDVKKYIRIKWVPFKQIILGVLITISLLPFCYFLSDFLLDLLGVPDSYRDMGEHLFTAHSMGQFIFLIFVVAVTPAICEEVFFRGYFQRTIERKAGFKSFIIGGILFGMFHLQPLGLLSLSILGVLFSLLYYRSKSLLPSSAAHFTNNFIALVLMYTQPKFLSGGVSFLWVLASLPVAAGLLILYLKSTKVDDANTEFIGVTL